MRSVLDSASAINLVTEHGVQRLGLHLKIVIETMQSMGQTRGPKLTGTVNVQFLCRRSSTTLHASLLVMKVITGHLPNHPIQTLSLNKVGSLQMADPNFAKPDPIVVLIGAALHETLALEESIKL